jgi:hypothetical protein
MVKTKDKYNPLNVTLGDLDELRAIDSEREALAELTDVIKWTTVAKKTESLADSKADWERVFEYFEDYGVEGDDLHLWRAYRTLIQQRYAGIYDDILRITDILARDYFFSFIRSPRLKRARIRYTAEAVPLTFLGRSEDYFYTYTVTTERPIAIISVPTSGIQSAWTWLALPHELGHNILANVIGLFKEITNKIDKQLRQHRYHIKGKPPFGVTHAQMFKYLWHAWMDEVAADFIAILYAGPSYVLSRLHDAIPEAYGVDEVDHFHLSIADMQIPPHPNCYVRIFFLCRLLKELDFPEEAEAIIKIWEAKHRNIEYVKVLDPGRHLAELFRIPVEELLRSFEEVVDVLCNAQLASLGRNTFCDIIRFQELDWEVAKYIASQLPRTDDTDIPPLARPGQILSASRLAFEMDPDAADTIHHNTIRAILGREGRAGKRMDPGTY